MDNVGVTTCSLSQFIANYLRMKAAFNVPSQEDTAKLAELALRGYHDVQYSIVPLNDRFIQDTNNPTVFRDYDSLIGFSYDSIPLLQEIYLYSVFNPVLTLRENTHLKVPFRMEENEVCPLVFAHAPRFSTQFVNFLSVVSHSVQSQSQTLRLQHLVAPTVG